MPPPTTFIITFPRCVNIQKFKKGGGAGHTYKHNCSRGVLQDRFFWSHVPLLLLSKRPSLKLHLFLGGPESSSQYPGRRAPLGTSTLEVPYAVAFGSPACVGTPGKEKNSGSKRKWWLMQHRQLPGKASIIQNYSGLLATMTTKWCEKYMIYMSHMTLNSSLFALFVFCFSI